MLVKGLRSNSVSFAMCYKVKFMRVPLKGVLVMGTNLMKEKINKHVVGRQPWRKKRPT
jgi:hypothetical protein